MFKFGKAESKRKGPRNEVLPQENDGLPDSYRPSGLCPRCGKQSSFDITGYLPVTYDYETSIVERSGTRTHDQLDRVASFICRHCNQGTVVVEEQWIGDEPKARNKSGGVISYRGIHWWPIPEARLSPDIPDEISGAFFEAVTTLMAKCPRASAVMTRRTLEAITVDKGETKGTLADRLDTMGANGILPPTLSDWGKEVRLIGNAGAHFDPISKITIEDAQQMVNFVRELLKYLYELPAELKKRRSLSP